MEQLAEKDQEEQEQKREHDTTKELINKATNIMVAAAELKNMQSVKVAQMMLKAENITETGRRLVLNKEISENDSMTMIRKTYLQPRR